MCWLAGNPSAKLIFLCVASVHTEQPGVDAPPETVPALLSPCVQLPLVSSARCCEIFKPGLLTGPVEGSVKIACQRILAARAVVVIPTSVHLYRSICIAPELALSGKVLETIGESRTLPIF